MYVILSGKVHIHDGDFVVASLHEGSFSVNSRYRRRTPFTFCFRRHAPGDRHDSAKRLLPHHQQISGRYQGHHQGDAETSARSEYHDHCATPFRQRELENMVRERTADIQKKKRRPKKAIAELKVTQEQLDPAGETGFTPANSLPESLTRSRIR